MKLKTKSPYVFIVFSVVMLSCLMVAQAVPSISLSFYKNNGYGMGSDISGYFTANADVSQDVVRVEFYLDNQLVQNDTSAPFSWAFDTSNYTLGMHNITAIAFNADNQTATAIAERNFVGFPLTFIVIIIVVVLIVVLLPLVWAIYKIRKRGKEKSHQ